MSCRRARLTPSIRSQRRSTPSRCPRTDQPVDPRAHRHQLRPRDCRLCSSSSRWRCRSSTSASASTRIDADLRADMQSVAGVVASEINERLNLAVGAHEALYELELPGFRRHGTWTRRARRSRRGCPVLQPCLSTSLRAAAVDADPRTLPAEHVRLAASSWQHRQTRLPRRRVDIARAVRSRARHRSEHHSSQHPICRARGPGRWLADCLAGAAPAVANGGRGG